MLSIKEFQGDFRFLSNFWPVDIEYEGFSYPSVEHAFQAAKTLDNSVRITILLAKTPIIAKRMGKLLILRNDWESIKIEVMFQLLRQKFSNTKLKQKLLNTGNSILEEGNYWNDTFWGICNGKGENNLGKLLMRVRSEIKCSL